MFDYEDEEIELDYFGGVDAIDNLELTRAIEDERGEDDEE